MGKLLNTEKFIERARQVHGDKYIYTETRYAKADIPPAKTCPKHGVFWQKPYHHLGGSGCSKCYNEKRGLVRQKNTEQFIEEATEKHKGFYIYTETEYERNDKEVCIICPIHGKFWQRPDVHLRGSGCPACRYIKSSAKITTTLEEFIERSNIVHNNKYIYTNSEYKGDEVKTCIICPEHGEFWQTPHHHLGGHGCPKCGRKEISELKAYSLIKKEFPTAIHQYKTDFLRNVKPMSIDIYIPERKIAIEYQGRQHFMALNCFGGEVEFQKIVERDKLKYQLCKDNGIKLFYLSMEHVKDVPETYLDKVYTDINELITVIKQQL